MKIIDLLNLMVVGEEDLPKKIKYNGYIFEYDNNHKRYESYFDEQIWLLEEMIVIPDNLTDEIEIIDENKKIEHKEQYVDFVNLTNDEKFDYLYEMETRIIDYITENKDV